MSGIFPKTKKNSKIKALVERALLPFAHLNQGNTGQEQNNLNNTNNNSNSNDSSSSSSSSTSRQTIPNPPYTLQTNKFQAQICPNFFIAQDDLCFGHLNDTHFKICFCITSKCRKELFGVDANNNNNNTRENDFFAKFKQRLNNKTLQLCAYKLLMWTEPQIKYIEATYNNAAPHILINVYDSPFYIQIDSAVIYNEMGNTLFGNPQPLRHIQLIKTLLDTGMYYYIRNIYLLQQADSTSYHIEIIDDDNNDNNKNGGTTSNNNNNLNNITRFRTGFSPLSIKFVCLFLPVDFFLLEFEERIRYEFSLSLI